jgi:hypothetical protein
MAYRCPLCLKELKSNDQLVRYCTRCYSRGDEATDQFNCTAENLPGKIICPRDECDGNGMMGSHEGVFVYHVGCDAHNPFFVTGNLPDAPHPAAHNPVRKETADDNTLAKFFSASNIRAHQPTTPPPSGYTAPARVVIPGGDLREADAVASCIMPGGSEPTTFTHWEILMLRALPPSEKMWFPSMLLRATAEEHQGKRIGALIGLVGEQAVGKTILAIQAIDLKGYVPPEQRLTHAVDVRDYIYSRPLEGATNVGAELLATLCLRSHMRDNTRGFFLPEGTPGSVGDLKVAFIRPTGAAEPARDRQASAILGGLRKLKTLTDKITAEAQKRIEQNTQNIPGYQPPALAQPAVRGQGRKPPFWYTISFYDTRGEHSRFGNKPLIDVINAVDKVAILVDARDLFGERSGHSLTTAKDNIRFYKDSKKSKCCLVVTQVDNLRSKKVKAALREAATKDVPDDGGRGTFGGNNAELLRRQLEESIARGVGRENREEVIHLLRSGLDTFFVWTEGLPTDEEPLTSEPTSYGLAQFVCWCLDVNPPDIIHTAS